MPQQIPDPTPAEHANPILGEPELVTSDISLPASEAGTPRRAASTFIFMTVTLDMLALGMIAPVLPRLITGFLHGDQASASRMIGVFGTLFAAMQFFFSPVLGSLSDRFGRRPIVLLSNFGLAADYVVMALAPTLPWLFVGRVVSGVTASSIPTAFAYLADVTPRERRAAAFGVLNAAFGVGFVLGPALGGILGSINPRLPFWVSGGLSLLNGCYGLLVLPESLPAHLRNPFSWRRATPSALLPSSAVFEGLSHSQACSCLAISPSNLWRTFTLSTLISAMAGPIAQSVCRSRLSASSPHLWCAAYQTGDQAPG